MIQSRFISNPRIQALIEFGDVQSALREPVSSSVNSSRLSRLVWGPEAAGDGLLAGLTLGDLLYDCIRVDPLVLEAIDFASGADLSNVLAFAHFAAGQADLVEAARQGSVSQLQGYVAERIAAQHLAAAGHDVSFPDSSSQPGWDLLVDGQPFQVKCVSSASAISSHLERYPNVPVIVNAEMVEEVGMLQGVYVDPALSATEVRQLTETTLARGVDIADFELPWIAVCVAGAVEIRDLVHGESRLDAAVLNVISDVSGKIVVGSIGELTGALLGGFLFGPAGVIIGGATGTIGGAISGGHLSRRMRGRLLKDLHDAVSASCQELIESTLEAMPGKLSVWSKKRDLIAAVPTSVDSIQGQIHEYTVGRVEDDLAYFRGKQDGLERLLAESTERADSLELARSALVLVRRAGIHPHLIQTKLSDLVSAIGALGKRERQLRLTRT